MCSLLTCMYALGLHNSASSSWKGRTYSQQVPFINLQVKAVGVPAIELIRHTWQAHLTPVEVLELTKDVRMRISLKIIIANHSRSSAPRRTVRPRKKQLNWL